MNILIIYFTDNKSLNKKNSKVVTANNKQMLKKKKSLMSTGSRLYKIFDCLTKPDAIVPNY